MLTGESPAHAAIRQPAPQAFKLALLDGETAPEGGHVERIQHFADAQTTLRQLQQHQYQPQQRIGLTGDAVGNRERYMTRIARCQLAEYRLDIGCVLIDIRHHHQDVTWAQ